MTNKNVIICNQCVMDNIGNNEIIFDEGGICNYCHEYRVKEKIRILPVEERELILTKLIAKIKSNKTNPKYDCLIGVSGGVDSTYTAYYVKKVLGLNPLAVHFDNGWNSELAIHNIQKVLEKLDIDLYTYVIDWMEFKDLQLSFLKASTPDGEIPTDHAITATLYQIADKHNIKYILSGWNFATEGIMPRMWSYGHIDWKYIKSVHKKYGSKKLTTYPHYTLFKFLMYAFVKGIKMVSILNYTDYVKDEAMKILLQELNWKYYGGKHYESNYTKYYQGIILPEKFKIDKRKLHLSALILNGQMTRNDAIHELKTAAYPIDDIDSDKEYIIKKLSLTNEKFDAIMKEDIKTFLDYPNSYFLHTKLRKILSYLRTKKLHFN